MKTFLTIFFTRFIVSILGARSMIGLMHFLAATTYAEDRGSYGSTPEQILINVKNRADPTNMTTTNLVQNPNLNSQAFGETNRISNTLDQIRSILDPFVQWMVFIGLTGAVVLIIRNAFGLSTSGVTGDENASKEIKTKIYNIIKGVVVISAGFYIIKLLMSAITYILQ